ncbi:MAG: restriction endonuclease subunit S [bacterium]|nr:restriction endonuclease subunit S [bacterium]
MKLEIFFEKFEQFAEAPNAVAKLREMIVQLAVQGKLVPNHTEDQPVSLKMSKFASKEMPMPLNWWRGILGDAIQLEYGDNLPAPKRTHTGEYPVYGSNGIVGTHDTYLIKEPAIIVGRKGSAGALNIATGPSWTTDVAYFVRPPSDLNLRFTYYLLSSLHLDILGKGIKPGLSRKDAYVLPIALPPLPEQKRIVAKVDELMSLCDLLEVQQQERDTRHAALARAVLARFADASTPANLGFLFHPSYNVAPADIRKTILAMAVQGKIVPQDPDDEPAKTLVSELAELRNQLLIDGIIKNQKISATLSEQELPFAAPDSWQWIRLGCAVSLLGGYAYPSDSYIPQSSNQIIRLGNVKNDDFLLNQKPVYIPDLLADKTTSFEICEDDILVTMTGTKAKRDYAYTLTVRREHVETNRLFLNQRVGAIRPFKKELVPLINLFLKSDQLLDLVFATATGTANQANIGTASILDLPFPLPPLAEQYRIVSKVNQLMALVDQLETQLAASRNAAINLMEAVVAELTTCQENAVSRIRAESSFR